jgi:hypothetical protein
MSQRVRPTFTDGFAVPTATLDQRVGGQLANADDVAVSEDFAVKSLAFMGTYLVS